MCGSKDVERISRRFRGPAGEASVEVDRCNTCGEQYFDPQALAAIQATRLRKRAG
jgi:hypothetical protein